MPHTWSFEKIKDYKKVCYDSKVEDGKKVYRLKQETDALIWITMGIGIDRITEKNIKKFCLRLGMLEEIDGHYLYETDADGERHNVLTERVIRKYIGLSTNASLLTDAKFERRVIRTLKSEVRFKEKKGFKSDLSVEKR